MRRQKKRILSIFIALLMVFTLFSGVATADYAQDDLSRSASGVIAYDDEIDPKEDERAEVEMQLRDSDRNSINDDVFFYIESNRDRNDMDIYYDEEEDYRVEYEGDGLWIVETDHYDADFHDGEFISFWVESEIEGDIELLIGIDKHANEVRRKFTGSEYGGDITITVLEYEAGHYSIYTPDEPAKANDNYTIEALVRDSNGDDPGARVAGVEVTFYERKEGTRSWEEVGTDTTSSRGWAEIEVTNEQAGSYEYTAEAGDLDRGYDEDKISVVAAEPSDIEAVYEVKDIDKGKDNIYFRIFDGYGNINKDIEHGVKNYEDYDDEDLEDFDYTERLEITAVDPDGSSTVYANDDIEYSDDQEAMYTEIDFDEFGQWGLEGRITGTSITAETTVNVKEFGTVEDMEIELDNPVMRNFEDGHEDYNFDHYEDPRVKLTLIDENDVRVEYDPSDDDVRFRTSESGIAGIDSREGIIIPRRTGQTQIIAEHQDEDVEVSTTLYLSNEPLNIEVEPDIKGGELTGQVTMRMVDEDGIRALPGEFDTYTDNDTLYVDSFEETGGYDLSVPDGITVEDEEDFKDGVATFSVEADDYGDYSFTVYSDVDISERFELSFSDRVTIIEMRIGSKVANIDGDDVEIEVAPVIREEDNRTFLPFRIVGELLGVDVDWDGELRSVTGEYEGTEVQFFVGEVTAYVDDEPIEIDARPYIDEEYDRTMIPFRFFAEAFGADVEWDDEEEKITVEM